MAAYFRPSSLAEALGIRARKPATVLAGGTDVYPARAARVGWGDMRREDFLDIGAIGALKGIVAEPGRVRFGALTTWSEMRRAPLPPAFAGWQKAARDIGGLQVQNRGTLVGNICTASPAGDGIPCLLSLDAEVELASERGLRVVPLGGFIDGYRHTVCAPDELVTAILVPSPPAGARGDFVKLGARRYLVISIVMAAAVIATDEAGAIAHARVAVGACSPVAQRLEQLEEALVGQPAVAAADLVEPRHLAGLEPIDDVRASGAFRAAAAIDVVRDLLAGLVRAGEGQGGVDRRRGGQTPRHHYREEAPAVDARGLTPFASVRFTVNGEPSPLRPIRSTASPARCATGSGSPAPRSAAMRATAAPARCSSTASRPAPASSPPARPKARRSTRWKVRGPAG
jgi:N-methylhydantoinase B